MRGTVLAALHDDHDMVLVLNDFTRNRGAFAYPEDSEVHHIGFIADSREQVDALNARLNVDSCADGWAVPEPRASQGAWTFYDRGGAATSSRLLREPDSGVQSPPSPGTASRLERYGATAMTASAALRGGRGRRKHDPERPFGARPIPVTQTAIEDSCITVLRRTSGQSRAGSQFFEAPRDSYGRLAACATIYTFRYGRLFVTSLSIPVSLSRHRAASLCFADRSETRASILSDEKGGFGQK